eukprot:COSAG03_NODE_311_length_9123_cov_2.643506_8_plen_435_part_00
MRSCHVWPQVLSVNQDTVAAVGTLVEKFSAHPSTAPEYAWAVSCNASDPGQVGWSYDITSKQLKWDDKCLDGSKGQSVTLADCGSPSKPGAQSWLLGDKRIWQADTPEGNSLKNEGVGNIALTTCAAPSSHPGQQWQYSLGGMTTNVQVNLTSRMGGCWEITGCATSDDASVGTTYGCKGLPQNCKSLCDCNGAWVFNAGNATITSVMSGKCLEAKTASAGSAVEVSTCTGKSNQQWSWHTTLDERTASSKITGQIASKASPNLCIDDGDFPAPPGTDGNCIALTHSDGGDGPAVSLVNPGNNGHCDPSKPPGPDESFSLSTSDGTIAIGTGQCMAALRGAPSPYGPMQLWAKPLQGGAVAVLLANRGTTGGVVEASVSLADLPGGLGTAGVKYTIRDLWMHRTIPSAGVLSADGSLTMKAPPQGSEFFIITPE